MDIVANIPKRWKQVCTVSYFIGVPLLLISELAKLRVNIFEQLNRKLIYSNEHTELM
jgi:hypothetical protein